MNKKDLEFILAYAEVHDLMQMPFAEAFHEVCTYVNDCSEYYDISTDEVVDDFLRSYKLAKSLGISFYLAVQLYEPNYMSSTNWC